MNQHVQDWVAALRSGNYQRTEGVMKKQLSEGEYGYCCLGVACELAGVPLVENAPESGMWHVYADDAGHQSAHLPQWLRDTLGTTRGFETELTGLNDGGWSFIAIADRIEEYFENQAA